MSEMTQLEKIAQQSGVGWIAFIVSLMVLVAGAAITAGSMEESIRDLRAKDDALEKKVEAIDATGTRAMSGLGNRVDTIGRTQERVLNRLDHIEIVCSRPDDGRAVRGPMK